MRFQRLLVGLAVLFCSAAASAQAWNVASSWGPPSNPNGVWAFGQLQPLWTFEPLTWDTFHSEYDESNIPSLGGAVWENTGTSALDGINPGQVSLDSSHGTAAVQFTAPTTGFYSFDIEIGGSTQTEGGGFGNALATNGHVSVNGTNLFWDGITDNVVTWRFTDMLTEGSTVDAFVLENNVTPGGNTALNFSVNAVPEPSSYLAIGCGLLGLLIPRSRSRIRRRQNCG